MGASIISGRQLNNGSLISGSGIPSPAIGKDKDYFIDKETSNLYGPKENGEWPSPIPFGKGAVINKMDSTGRLAVTSITSQLITLPVKPNYIEVYLNGIMQADDCFSIQDNIIIVNTARINAQLSDQLEVTYQSIVLNEVSELDDISHATLFILGL